MVACLVASALLVSPSVRAAPQRASLNWVRAPGASTCVSSAQLARQVEAWIGPMFVPPAEASIAIEGLAVQDGSGYVARIVVSDAHGGVLGERRLAVQGDCASLTLQVAFVIAVTLDPEAAFAALPPEVEALLGASEDVGELLARELEQHPATPAPFARAEPTPAAPVEGPVLAPSPAAPAARPRSRSTARTRAGLGALWGLLPGTLPSLGVAQLWSGRYVGFELALVSLLPARVELEQPATLPSRSLRTWGLRGRFGLCHAPLGRNVTVMACADAGAGVVGRDHHRTG